MNFKDYLHELAFPARSLGMMISLITFYLFLGLVKMAGLLGIWLAVVVVPALFRYLVMIAQARARGVDAEPPGADFFSLVGNMWTLFPALPAFAVARGWMYFDTSYGATAALVFALVAAMIVPAMMAVLVITRSPAQSLNPIALYTLVRETGNTYWYAPLTLLLVSTVPRFLTWLPAPLQLFAALYLVFAFYAVTGAITREKELINEVYIEDPLEPDAARQVADLARVRMDVLSHAYGFVSRGNRHGGLQHIADSLASDPDPDAAWAWYFEGMLKWENQDEALWFAQRYLARLLAGRDVIRANKLILRCRLINERFRPLPEDFTAAIAAAEACGNQELAGALKRL